jgi:phage terminase small subunit
MSVNKKPWKLGDRLTFKQEKWIEEYIKCDNLTEATINAGYTCKNPRAMGYQNSVRFKELIDKRRLEIKQKIKKDSIANLEEVFEFWTKVFNDKNEVMKDRLKASELLAKAKGGFVEKVEVKQVDTDWFIDEE